MDWYRTQFDILYRFDDLWDFELQMPFDVKDQTAEYHINGVPFHNPDGELHHRNEKLEGISDFKVFAIRKWKNAFLKDDFINFSFGMTLPLGRTEEDPIRRGENEIKHQHIQFGNGTFDPLLRVHYGLPVNGKTDLFFSLSSQLPFYENRKSYRPPRTNEFTCGPIVSVGKDLKIGLFYSVVRQGYAHWHGRRDVNSGYTQQSAVLTLPWNLTKKYTINPTLIKSLDIDTFSRGDGFELDWMYVLSLEVNF